MTDVILVGVNDSGPSDAAVDWALQRAVALSMDFTLLRATDADRDTLDSGASTTYEHTIARVRRTAGLGRVRHVITSGDAMQGLATASANAAMVVVGTNKTGFIRGQVFGSRTLQLAASAHCPVAVIPEPSHRVRRRIAVAVEDSLAGRAAVRFAAAEAERLDEELVLISAHRALARLPHGGYEDPSRDMSGPRLLASAAAHARETCPTVAIQPRSGDIAGAEALIDASASSALLVIPTGEAGPANLFDGLAHDVLLNLAGPTVVVHAGD